MLSPSIVWLEIKMRLILQSIALATTAATLSGCGVFQPAQSRQAQVTLHVADAALEAGAPDMALRVAEIVLRRDPHDVAAMVAKGQALYAMGAADQARAIYRQAAAADPANPDAQIGLGRTLVRSDPHGAEVAFLAALAVQPDNVLALNDLGIARDMLGRHEEAQAAYRQALALSPESSDVQTNLGLSLALSGDRTGAMQTLQPVASAPEATAMQRADLAVAMARTGAAKPAAEVVPSVQAARVDDAVAPLAIHPAPVAVVHRETLAAKPAAPVVVAGPAPVVDLATVKADASAVIPVASIPAVVERAVEVPVSSVVVMNPESVSPTKWSRGYYVQMGALDSVQGAMSAWGKLRARWPDLLAGRAPAVQQADVNQRTFWRLRTGIFADAGSANDFCIKMHVAGSGCWAVLPGRE
jgi:Flp pilus assembly protein TadD